MHNLIKKDLEKLDISPREQYSEKHSWGHYWGKSTSDCHRIGDYYPYKIAKRVIKKFVGKTFDQAFAYYCTLVPKYQQHEFLEEFEEDCRHWYKPKFTVEDGIIVDNRIKEKKIYTFYSDDFLSGYFHKITKKEITREDYNRGYFYPNYSYKRVYINKEDYEFKTIKGWSQDFESPKDSRYIRLLREQQKRRAIKRKEENKARSNKAYCFMTKDEIEKKKLAETDELTRDRHGFDKTTFMGIEYHGQKRKRKDLL